MQDKLNVLTDTRDESVLRGVVASRLDSEAGPRLMVTVQPYNHEVECEVAYTLGDYVLPDVNDEVMVVFPNRDRLRAVALLAVPGKPDPVPSSWDGSDRLIVHAGGLRVQTTDSATVEPVMLAERLQPDLSALLSALEAFAAAVMLAAPLVPATPLSPLNGSAAALQTALQSLALKTRLAASAYSASALKSE